MEFLQKAYTSSYGSLLDFYDALGFSPLVKKHAVVLIGIAVLYLVFKILVPFFLRRLEKFAKRTKNDLDEFLVEVLSKVRWPVCLILVLMIVMGSVDFSPRIHTGLRYFLIVFVTYWAIKVITQFVNYGVRKIAEKKGPGASALLPVFAKVTNVIVWAIGIVFVISNLGYQVTPLVTGLGIGGIAIALAVQNILGDLISSVSIYLDKPFKVGDYIVMDTLSGTVKSVGVKTTRITSLRGEELVIPNQKLVNSTIQNFKRMKERRVDFSIGVAYETKPAKLAKIPGMIERIIKGAKNTEFGRAHFAELGDFSLNFETVYYVKSNEYEEYMNIQQGINFALIEAFAKEKIEFAYPTQKVFVER